MIRSQNIASCRGFTLVEVMVTLFIIAIGALGIAGLQVAGMRSNHSAFQRSQATLAAYALVDRMRADPDAFVGANIDTTSPDSNVSFKAWADELARLSLSEPLGALDCSDGNDCNSGQCTITISWDDSRAEADDLMQSGRDAEATQSELCARVPQ